MKRTIAIVMAICMMFGLCVFAFAEDTLQPDLYEETITNEITEQDVPSDTQTVTSENALPNETEDLIDPSNEDLEDPTDMDEPTEEPVVTPDPNEIVACVYLCASNNIGVGHVWLYFENLTDHPITVGYYELEPGCGCTVSQLSSLHPDGMGTYYNFEAYKYQSKLSRAHYLAEEITYDELVNVSHIIRSHNSYELFFNNCGRFATTIWNSISDRHIMYFFLPLVITAQMGNQRGVYHQKVTVNEVFKQQSAGGIQPCSEVR